MARFGSGDYAFVGYGGRRVRIEQVVQDDPANEANVVYFIVDYMNGGCGNISGAQLVPDRSGLPSKKVAEQKARAMKGQVDALVRGLKTMGGLAQTIRRDGATGLARQQAIRDKIAEREETIAQIDREWSPSYYANGFQPFNNLLTVQNIAYTPTKLQRRPNGTYFMVTAADEIPVNATRDGMEFVILFDNPDVVLVGTVGHSPMAKGKQVLFAGHVFFDVGGQLLKWDNNSGHYKTVRQYAHQAASAKDRSGEPLLPPERFQDAGL